MSQEQSGISPFAGNRDDSTILDAVRGLGPRQERLCLCLENMAERVLRLDPKTSEVIEYQIPTDFDSKEILHRSSLGMRDRRLVGHAKVPRRDLRHSSLSEALTAESEVRGATDSCETR